MDVLQFIAWIFTSLLIAFVIIAIIAVRWDYLRITKENEKLKNDLHNARKRKMEKENK